MKIPKVGAYFASNVIQAGLQFLLVPLLVRALGPAEYGRWGLLEPVIATLAMVAQFGTNWGILKLVNQDGVPATTALRFLVVRGWWLACLVAIASGGGLWLLRHDLLAALGLMLVVLAEACLGLVLAAARSENRASAYAAGVLVKFAGITALVAACVFFRFPQITSASALLMWWGGVVLVAAVVGGIKLFVSGGTGKGTSSSVSHSPSIATAVAYGLPLLGASLLGTVLNSVDRFVVEKYVSAEQLGAYIVALKVAGAMNFILTPIALWWPTARFEHVCDSDGGQAFFSDMAEKLAILYGMAGACLWIISPVLVRFFAPQMTYSPFVLAGLCIAVVFRGMEPPLNIGLLKEGKTHWSMVMVGVGAMAQICLCLYAVPKWGAVGAAFATAVSSVISTGLVHLMSQRIHPVDLKYSKILAFILVPWIVASMCNYFSIIIPVSIVLICAGFGLPALYVNNKALPDGRKHV